MYTINPHIHTHIYIYIYTLLYTLRKRLYSFVIRI